IEAMLHGPARGHAVRAAGVLGSISLVEPLLALLDDPQGPPQERLLVQRALWMVAGLPPGDARQTRRAYAERADAFHADGRFRLGQPFHPAVLVQMLKLPEMTRGARQD